ncbi:MAG: hypothetical protein COB04_18580 [Gammaproteobacteria bacterium]|nr:MAG: hypothetical protein COB04_18580 [Gammaproteobacteria bacterium]
MRTPLLIIVSLFIFGCASSKSPYIEHTQSLTEIPDNASYHLTIPSSEGIPFSGLVSFDGVEAAGYNGLYPGGSGAVVIAALLVHSATVESSKNRQKSELQSKADQILVPYHSAIENLSAIDLINDTNMKIVGLNKNTDVNATEIHVQSKPLYLISEDEKTLVLRNIVIAHSGEDANNDNVIYKNMIEVHSNTASTDAPQSHWISNDEENFRNVVHSLYVESIQLAMDDIKNALLTDSPEKTFTYYQSNQKQYERGSLVRQQEGRIAIRTLRGWLMSVPSSGLTP